MVRGGCGDSSCGARRGATGRHRGRPLRGWLGRAATCLNRRGIRCLLVGDGLCAVPRTLLFLLCSFFSPLLQSLLWRPLSRLRATVSLRRRCTSLRGAALRGKGLGLVRRFVVRRKARGNGTAQRPSRVHYYLYSALSFPPCSSLPSGNPFGANAPLIGEGAPPPPYASTRIPNPPEVLTTHEAPRRSVCST